MTSPARKLTPDAIMQSGQRALLRAVKAGAGAVITDKESRPDSSAQVIDMHRARDMSFTLTADGPMGRNGERITLSVTPADTTNQNEEIDTWLGGYQNFGFVADMVSPVVLVDQEKARRRDFSLENTFERIDPKVGRHGGIREIEHMSQTVAYETQEYALAAYVPYGAEEGQRYDVKKAHAQMIAEKLALDRECRVFELLTTSANWNAAQRTTLGSATLKWDTGATRDPLQDLQSRISASNGKVTGILMNDLVLFHFLNTPSVQTRMRQMYGDNAPDASLASAAAGQGVTTFTLLGLPPITVCPAKVYNASTGLMDNILGDDVVLLVQPGGVPSDGTRMATSMTFRTKGRSGTGWTTNEYVPQSGRGLEKGTMMESGFKEDIFLASNTCGGLIKDVLAS